MPSRDTLTLMIQGTTSDAGKSALVTGLGRVLHRRGYKVAPFKPQNMALNSMVTAEGGEIARAQVVQAQACGIAPTVHMNPVLLKPNSDTGAQVILQGKARGNMPAGRYHDYKPEAMEAVLDSHRRLCQDHDIVLVEGAGSPAEINLRDRDIANMGFAEAVDCPVILIADIDRGGVFAHLVGTLQLLSESEQARVQGFVINRFRGDPALLQSGLDWLEDYTNKPVLGVLPYLHGLHLDAEDALPRDREPKPGAQLTVVVPALPRISNHTDFDPLRLHPQVDLRFAGPGESLAPADLIIIPGSKSVRQDLAWLREQGWDAELARHLRHGGKILGICGGLQMLGNAVHDPTGVEGNPGTSPGLGLLDFETELAPDKQLRRVAGTLELMDTPAQLTGYEIHAGHSNGPALDRPLTRLHAVDGPDTAPWPDGAVSPDGRVAATYVHGLFESSDATTAILQWAGLRKPETLDFHALRERNIDRLADACEANLDIDAILRLNESRARSRIRQLSENSQARIGVNSWRRNDLYER